MCIFVLTYFFSQYLNVLSWKMGHLKCPHRETNVLYPSEVEGWIPLPVHAPAPIYNVHDDIDGYRYCICATAALTAAHGGWRLWPLAIWRELGLEFTRLTGLAELKQGSVGNWSRCYAFINWEIDNHFKDIYYMGSVNKPHTSLRTFIDNAKRDCNDQRKNPISFTRKY